MTNKEFFNKISSMETGKEPVDESILDKCEEVMDNNTVVDKFYADLFFNKKFTWQVEQTPKIWTKVWNKFVTLSK